MEESINNIVIVGGGTAGWISAACLAKVLANTNSQITLVESPEVDTVGVGEATIPPLVEFMRFLGIEERDFIEKTQATFKLAIKFTDWCTVGEHYWHQFGSVGADIDGKAFYQHWYKSTLQGNKNSYTDYSPSIAMAKYNKFFIPSGKQKSILDGSTYAWHFDARLVATYLKDYAIKLGVTRIEGHVEKVAKHPNGFIDELQLVNGQMIKGDFFIDCTGQRALLIEGAMGSGFESWEKYLPMNRAVAMQTENVGAKKPYTESIAHKFGWQWQIPLQHRTGNGLVFCDNYASDDEALKCLQDNVQGKVLTDPKFLPFRTGKRDKIWKGNCLAIGLSSGFMEPLESTSIHLIMKAIVNFVQVLPDKQCRPASIKEFNRIMDLEYESIRDFIVLHYCTTQRTDSEFWLWCQHMKIPNSLEEKLALFKEQGRLYRNEYDLFTPPSWYAVLAGMKVNPQNYDRLVDISHVKEVEKIMQKQIEILGNIIPQLPSHDEFILHNCASSIPKN